MLRAVRWNQASAFQWIKIILCKSCLAIFAMNQTQPNHKVTHYIFLFTIFYIQEQLQLFKQCLMPCRLCLIKYLIKKKVKLTERSLT